MSYLILLLAGLLPTVNLECDYEIAELDDSLGFYLGIWGGYSFREHLD